MAAPRPSTALGMVSPAAGGPSLIPRRTSLSTGVNPLSRSAGSSSGSVLGSAGLPLPTTNSLATRTLKRSSGQAGLQPPATAKRTSSSLTAASLVPSTPSSSSIAALRADIQASESVSAVQRQLHSAQRENGQILREIGALQERVKHLERERSILLAREDKSLAKDAERESRQDEERRVLVDSLGEFRLRCSTLEEEVSLLTSSESQARHARDMAEQQRENIDKQMVILQEELIKLEHAMQLRDDDRDSLATAKEEILNLRRQLAEQAMSPKIKSDSPTPPVDHSVTDVLRRELHHQVTHLRTLEHNNARLQREVAALKAERQNAELLKEEKQSLETKLRHMSELRHKLAAAESEVQSLKREKDEWAAFLSRPATGREEEERFSSPAHLAKTLASTRIEALSLQEKQGTLHASLRSRDELIKELETRIGELEDDIVPRYEKETSALMDRLRAAERSTALDKRELEMLREQIATYATEEASLSRTVGANGTSGSLGQMYDSQKSLRISHLEELLQAHKQEAARAVKEAERLRGQLEARGDETGNIDAVADVMDEVKASEPPRTPSKAQAAVAGRLTEQLRLTEDLQEKLRQSDAELEEMRLELDSLEAQIDGLNLALGRGEYNTGTTKVVSLADNPAASDLAVRTETLDRLKEENRVLLERLSTHAEQIRDAPLSSTQQPSASDPVEETIPKQTFVNLQSELACLNETLEQERKSRMRLKEIFQRTAQEVREACRCLLGYKLEPLENGRIKLTSVFGGSEYNLVFGPSTSAVAIAKYQLVSGGDQFVNSQRVQTGLEFWVAQRQNIPGFLASITLELFEESTQGRISGWADSQE